MDANLQVVIGQLAEMRKQQRDDIQAVYTQMREDRIKADEKRESDRAIFMAQIKDLFANGCASATVHKDTAAKVKSHEDTLIEVKNAQQRIIGILWFIGIASPIAAAIGPKIFELWKAIQ